MEIRPFTFQKDWTPSIYRFIGTTQWYELLHFFTSLVVRTPHPISMVQVKELRSLRFYKYSAIPLALITG